MAKLTYLLELEKWQRVWRHVGEYFPDVTVVCRVTHGAGGVTVGSGCCMS